MGKNIAPATRKPHIACAKQVKMCVSHAAKQANPMNAPQFMLAPYLRLMNGVAPPAIVVGRLPSHFSIAFSCT